MWDEEVIPRRCGPSSASTIMEIASFAITTHSNLEKDNSLKTTPVLAQRWAVWSILTKN